MSLPALLLMLLTMLVPLALPVSAAPAAARADGLQACQLRGVDVPARCGQIERLLDPAAPDGVRIRVHYAVLPALSRNKRADPVFFFAGGPGQSAIDLAGPASRLLARLGQRRDIVLVDQRGTGRSAPLYCDDEAAPPSLRDSTDAQRVQQQLVQCRAALQRLPHGDLRHYTTTLAMQDVDAVRQVLGTERINLVGVSYGTRAALELQRQFPATVRRVVLDGVAPPDMGLPQASVVDAQAAFDALLAWCSGDEACRQQHPALAQRWAALRAALPAEVALPDPLTGRIETLHLDVGLLGALVRSALYSPLLSSALPAALDEAVQGRWSALAGLASALAPAGRARIALGQHFSVICAEDTRPTTATAAGGAFDDMTERYRQACADWPRGTVPAAFYTLQPSAQPVLLLSGALDPVTPPRHAAAVARRLGDKARQLVVPGGGHGVLALACVRELAQRFIDASEDSAALALDTGCAAAVPRPPLFQPPGLAAAAHPAR